MRVLALFLALQIPLGLDRGLLAPPDNLVTPEKAALGRRLFFDTRLSEDHSRACADCHNPELAFSDGKRVAVGVRDQQGTRNAPAIINRTYGRTFFWDGRVATLEEQVLQPIQDQKEMAADLSTVVQRLRADATYQQQFDDIFGRPPDARSLSSALATYVRTILAGASPYDRYQAGDTTALSSLEQHGLRLFRGRARCARCHSGSNLTDEGFHNTGVSWGRHPYDAGRVAVTGLSGDTGKFKTPTLREVERTAPYMHDGSIATLEEVVSFYDRGGNANPYRDHELRPLSLTAEEKGALVAILKSVSGQIREGTAQTSGTNPVTRPAISEEISPVEELSVATQDGRTAIAVFRKPPGEGPFPAVVAIHGGGGPTPLSELRNHALSNPTMTRFLAAGYVTMIPTFYLTEDPQAMDALWDTLAAVEHVKQMPAVDPTSVVLYGCSSGGDLVLELAGATDVAATTAEEPASIRFTGMLNRDTLKAGASLTVADAVALWAEPHRFYTPALQRFTQERIRRVSGPLFIARGDQQFAAVDHHRIVTEILIPELKTAGKEVEEVVYPGQHHCFGFYGGRFDSQEEGSRRFFADMHAFFVRHLPTQPLPLPDSVVRQVPVQ